MAKRWMGDGNGNKREEVGGGIGGVREGRGETSGEEMG